MANTSPKTNNLKEAINLSGHLKHIYITESTQSYAESTMALDEALAYRYSTLIMDSDGSARSRTQTQ